MKTAPRTVLIYDLTRTLAAATIALVAALCSLDANAQLHDAASADDSVAVGLSSEPYSVFVAYDKAFARCGPSSEYYRTDPLRHGQKLEVYVQTDDGWLGVRPPEESFCWVPAATIQTNDRGQSGEVIEDRTVAWIGTNLGRAKRYRWQVQLAEGEPVSIIGRSEREGPDGPQLWYRIVPPSGEFRWIHQDQVVKSAEELVARASREQNAAVTSALPERGTKPSLSRFGNLADRGKSILAKAISDKSDNEGQLNVARIEPAKSQQELEMEVSELLSSDRRANDPMIADAPGIARASGESSRRNRPLVNSQAASPLQPMVNQQAPVLSVAPRPSSSPSEQTVGSGLNQQWDNNTQAAAPVALGASQIAAAGQPTLPAPIRSQPTLSAAADFISRPRLIDIGSTVQTSAPNSADVANDGNWIAGNGSGVQANGVPQPNPVQQASGIMHPNNMQANQSYGHPVASYQPTLNPPPKIVSQAVIDSITAEASQASVEQLHLMLSRLMASSATSLEAQPIADAAGQLAASATDELINARARLLSERVGQYQRVAQRRDGQALISGVNGSLPQSQNNLQHGGLNGGMAHSSVMTASAIVPIASSTTHPSAGQMQPQPIAPVSPSATGYLVQVYSARQNSPPYALTDNVGNTIAYVTPAPGVNLRHHINNEVSISGNEGYVQGLNTPHIIAHEANRVVAQQANQVGGGMQFRR